VAGPYTFNVLAPHVNNPTEIMQISVPAGVPQTLNYYTVTWSHSPSSDTQTASCELFIYLLDASGNWIGRLISGGCQSSGGSHIFQFPPASFVSDFTLSNYITISIRVAPCFSIYHGDVTFSITPLTISYCPYGVQEKPPGYKDIVQVSLSTLEAIGFVQDAPWAVPLVLAAGLGQISIGQLCSSQPPSAVDIVNSDWTTVNPVSGISHAIEKTLNNFQNQMWQYFCECKPATGGGAAPVTPPAPNWDISTYYDYSTHTIIDEHNLATQIDILWQTINQLAQTINNIFSYTNNSGGTITNIDNSVSSLTNVYTFNPPPTQTPVGPPVSFPGPGVQTAPAIRGLVVTLTSAPADMTESMTDPNTYYRVGYVHIGTDLGWHRAVPIHASPQLVELQPGDTKWVLTLSPSVSADVQPYSTP
jgi:hypothetical protein